jgi:carboxylesterase type B
VTHHPISSNAPPSQHERQRHGLALGELATLRQNPKAAQTIEAMCVAAADRLHEFCKGGPNEHDQKPWTALNEPERDSLRLQMIAAMEAARRIKAQREEMA